MLKRHLNAVSQKCHKSATKVPQKCCQLVISTWGEHRRPWIHPAWRGLKREVLPNLENLHLNLQSRGSQAVVLKQQHFHHSGTLLKLGWVPVICVFAALKVILILPEDRTSA